MGYESKIIVVDRNQHEDWVYGGEIARFDLSKMGYDHHNGKEFRELFTIPVDFDLNVNSSDDVVPASFYREDCYGEICKYTEDIDEVIAWLEQSEARDPYRRAKLFLNFLRVLKDSVSDFRQIVLVHYGY